ncbi:MAG: thymidine kinase [Planctomycetota bacterium]
MTYHPDPNHPPLGRLEVICGPMFTGKTTELIHRLARAEVHGYTALPLKPTIDDRYHPTDLTTHYGRSLTARTITSPAEMLPLAREADAEVVGLDEAHFFMEGLHSAVMDLLREGHRVILAGLDRTSLNEPFAEMARLLIEADDVTKTIGACTICGRPAVHTVRLFDSKEDIVVGGEGMFENRCRGCVNASA